MLEDILSQTKGHPAEKLAWCCSMSPLPSLPNNLQDWINTLDAVQLPALASDVQKARQALGNNTQYSLREIAQQLQAIPALTLSIMREANTKGYSQEDRAETLEAALTRLGMQRAHELLNKIPVVELNEDNWPFFQVLLISQHACQQANGLFSARLARIWQEVYWNTLLFMAPLWVIICAYPKLFRIWERSTLERAVSSRADETQLLGLPVLTLCQGLAEHWRLPHWTVRCYRIVNQDQRFLVKALRIAQNDENPLDQQQNLDADPELRRWLTQPENTPLLANTLATMAHHGWGSVQMLRWQRLAALYVEMPLPTLQQRIHQQAVLSAQQQALSGLWHPAQALIWPWTDRFSGVEYPSSTAKTVQSVPEELTSIQRWKAACAELLSNPSPFANILQLSAKVQEALLSAGVQRLVILQLDAKRNLLVTRQSAGLASEAKFLQLDPAHSPLVQNLLQHPRQLYLTAEHSARVLELLPGAIKSLFDSQHLLIQVVSLNKTVMLLVADRTGAALDERLIQVFAKTMQCFEKALGYYTKYEP